MSEFTVTTINSLEEGDVTIFIEAGAELIPIGSASRLKVDYYREVDKFYPCLTPELPLAERVYSKIAQLLDGAFQFRWTLEKGLLDTKVLKAHFDSEDLKDIKARVPLRFQLLFISEGMSDHPLTLCNCSVDTFTMEEPKDRARIVRWAGLAEGIYSANRTSEEKTEPYPWDKILVEA